MLKQKQAKVAYALGMILWCWSLPALAEGPIPPASWPASVKGFCKNFLDICFKSCTRNKGEVEAQAGRPLDGVSLAFLCQQNCWRHPARSKLCKMSRGELLRIREDEEQARFSVDSRELEEEQKKAAESRRKEEARQQEERQRALKARQEFQEQQKRLAEEQARLKKMRDEIQAQASAAEAQKRAEQEAKQKALEEERSRLESQRRALEEEKKRIAILQKQEVEKRKEEERRQAEEAKRLAVLERLRQEREQEIVALRKQREEDEKRRREAQEIAEKEKKLAEERRVIEEKRQQALLQEQKEETAKLQALQRKLQEEIQAVKVKKKVIREKRKVASLEKEARVKRLAALRKQTHETKSQRPKPKRAIDPGLKAYTEGRPDEARQRFEKAGDSEKVALIMDFLASYRNGSLAHQQRNPEVAISELEKALTLDLEISGGVSVYTRSLRMMLANMHVSRGMQAMSKKAYSSAFICFDVALRHKSDHGAASEQMRELRSIAESLYQEAVSYKQNDPSRCRKLLRDVIKLIPREDELYKKAKGVLEE